MKQLIISFDCHDDESDPIEDGEPDADQRRKILHNLINKYKSAKRVCETTYIIKSSITSMETLLRKNLREKSDCMIVAQIQTPPNNHYKRLPRKTLPVRHPWKG